MLNKTSVIYKIYQDNIFIQCPKCQIKSVIKVPRNIVTQSQHLTTVFIPFGLVCNHSFSAFIDKNFKVRGYQKVDYELSEMDICGLTELKIKKEIS